MTNFAYTKGIPATNDNPSDDQPNMLVNNDNAYDIWNVDHIGFELANGGFHKLIHLPNAANGGPSPGGQTLWNPFLASGVYALVSATATPGIQQLFTMNYTPAYAGAPTDTQLFSMSGTGGISQLTGNNAISNGGWQWIGGTLMIWGTASILGANPIVFTAVSPTTIPFPNNCFQVTTTVVGIGASAFAIEISAISKTQFSWQAMGSVPAGVSGFFWLAIGN